MTDKDKARQLVEKVTSLPGYTSMAGTQVLNADVGYVEMAVEKRQDLLQFNGFFHGGVISGLADHAAGGAVTTAMPKGKIGVTIDLHVNFLAPAKGEKLVAKARAIQSGSSISVAQVDVYSIENGDEVRCAVASVTLRSVDMPLG